MDDIAGLNALVIVSQPGIDPERLNAHNLLLLFPHGPRHVHHVNDYSIGLLGHLGFETAISLIIPGDHDSRVFGVVHSRRDLALEGLPIAAFEVTQRFGSDLGDTSGLMFDYLQRRRALWLDLREVKLFAKDLRQLINGNLSFQRVLSLLVTSLALPPAFAFADGIAFFTIALPNSALTVAAEFKARNLDLRHRDGNGLVALLTQNLTLRDILAQVLANRPLDDLAKPGVVLLYVLNGH